MQPIRLPGSASLRFLVRPAGRLSVTRQQFDQRGELGGVSRHRVQPIRLPGTQRLMLHFGQSVAAFLLSRDSANGAIAWAYHVRPLMLGWTS